MEDEADRSRIATRVEALESRTAHQDRIIDELNTTILAQWAEIDRMKHQLGMIGERLAAGEGRARVQDQKPPHY